MKKIFAMILCLAMLLSSAALAETAPDIITAFENTGKVSGTLETEVTLSVDESALNEIMAATGGSMNGMEQIIPPIISLINNLKLRVLAAEGEAQMELILKDTGLLTIGTKKADDGTMMMVTDLLPNYILKGDLAKAGASGMASVKLTEEEQKAITEAGKAKMNQVIEDIKAKQGEAETGSWDFDGVTFTEKKPVNITTKEVTVMTLKAVKELFEDPAVKKLTDAMGDQFDTKKLDESIAEAEKKDDSEYPTMTWYLYTNAEGNEYHDIVMEKNGEQITMAFSLIGKKLAVHGNIAANGNGKIEGLVDAENKTISITADIENNGTPANVAFDLAAQDDGSFAGVIAMSMTGKKLLSINISGKATSEQLAVSFDEEGKKVVPLEALSDGSSAEGQELMSALQTALPGILQKAMKAMPEEISTLMMLFTGGMQQ